MFCENFVRILCEKQSCPGLNQRYSKTPPHSLLTNTSPHLLSAIGTATGMKLTKNGKVWLAQQRRQERSCFSVMTVDDHIWPCFISVLFIFFPCCRTSHCIALICIAVDSTLNAFVTQGWDERKGDVNLFRHSHCLSPNKGKPKGTSLRS